MAAIYRGERPHCAGPGHELPHSITSQARASNVAHIRPSVFKVFKGIIYSSGLRPTVANETRRRDARRQEADIAGRNLLFKNGDQRYDVCEARRRGAPERPGRSAAGKHNLSVGRCRSFSKWNGGLREKIRSASRSVTVTVGPKMQDHWRHRHLSVGCTHDHP